MRTTPDFATDGAQMGGRQSILRGQSRVEAMEGSILGNLKLSIFVIFLTLAIAGCGGSDSAPPATGKVAVLLTDGPSQDFEQILITLDRMLLLGGHGGHQVLYEGDPITFDLLDMQDRADFAFASEVLADDYSKIRLEVSDIQLVDLNGSESTPVSLVDLPANGKIDLNPQGPFTVLPGQTIVVEIDIDANRSFHPVEQGNGAYRLRPVIFVNVYPDDLLLRSKFVRVFGNVEQVTAAGPDQHVVVCSLSFVSQLGSPVTGDPQDCVRIFANDTSIFDENGMAVAFSQLAPPNEPPTELTGIGYVTPDGADVLFNLDAVVMEIGPRQSATDPVWETLRGVVGTSGADCDGILDAQLFCFEPLDPASPITTRLQPGTRIFDASGSPELDATAIDTGDTGTVDGLRADNGSEELLAALVVLNPDPNPGLVSGVVEMVEFDQTLTEGTFDVLTLDTMEKVCVNAETDLLRILVDDGIVTIVDLLDPQVLVPQQDTVEATGTPSVVVDTGCDLIADVVVVE